MLQEKIWLVKSSTRILGPFSFDDVGRLLKQRQISSIDEIRTPDQRWTFLRDRREFMELMKVMRQQPESVREETQTSTSTATLTVNTKTFTDVTIPTLDDGLTPTPVPKPNPIPAMKDVTPISKPAVGNPVGISNVNSSIQSYGSTADAKIQAKISATGTKVWLIAGVLVAILIIFVMFKKSNKETKNYSFKDYVAMALRAKNIGSHRKALEYLKKAEALGTVDSDTDYQLAPLLILMDGQTVRGRRAIEKEILKPKRSRQQIIEGNNLLGLAALHEKDFKKAEESFSKVLGLDPSNANAAFNMGMIFLEKGSPREAQVAIIGSQKLGLRDDAARLSLLLADIEIGIKLGSKSGFEEGLIEARSLAHQSVEEKQKALFVNAYLENRLGTSTFQTVADNALDQIPATDEATPKNFQIYSKLSSWMSFSKYCEELYNRDGVVPKVKALVALCYTKIGKEGEAIKLLEDALNQTPQDPVLLAFQAYLYTTIGKASDAQASLNLVQDKSLKLPYHVRALMCSHRDDVACAKENWDKVLQLDPRNVEALKALAKLALDQKKNSQAIEAIKRGLMISPQNVTLLEYRDQLEGGK